MMSRERTLDGIRAKSSSIAEKESNEGKNEVYFVAHMSESSFPYDDIGSEVYESTPLKMNNKVPSWSLQSIEEPARRDILAPLLNSTRRTGDTVDVESKSSRNRILISTALVSFVWYHQFIFLIFDEYLLPWNERASKT